MSVQGIRTTLHIQRCLQRLGRQDEAARTELLGHARRRLGLLAERMFAEFPMLHRREEADDLLQEALVRLWQSLTEVGPTTVAGFMGLAALQMRRALRDLARHHFGRKDESGERSQPRQIVNGTSGHTFEERLGDSTWRPDDLACWSEFHAAADRLPEPERTAFDLLYYHELPQSDAAEIMQISERQVRRHWQSARRELHRALEGLLPKM
jgi:RNA polymerase sigma-70 factor (ECF subfamily)